MIFRYVVKEQQAQQDLERLIYKPIMYILHAGRFSSRYKCSSSSIIAMDKTSVWNDMVSNTIIEKQGAKSVCLKTNGHEKCIVSVCLASKADETKLKPFAVFGAGNRASKSLDEKFKSLSSGNAMMNEEQLTLSNLNLCNSNISIIRTNLKST